MLRWHSGPWWLQPSSWQTSSGCLSSSSGLIWSYKKVHPCKAATHKAIKQLDLILARNSISDKHIFIPLHFSDHVYLHSLSLLTPPLVSFCFNLCSLSLSLPSLSLSLPYTLLLSFVCISSLHQPLLLMSIKLLILSAPHPALTICPLSSKSPPFWRWITYALLQPLNQALLLPKQNQEPQTPENYSQNFLPPPHPTSSDSWWIKPLFHRNYLEQFVPGNFFLQTCCCLRFHRGLKYRVPST